MRALIMQAGSTTGMTSWERKGNTSTITQVKRQIILRYQRRENYEEELDKIHITLNKNQIPNDQLPPLKSSGVRIGTPAMTTKGWKEEDFEKLASIMMEFLKLCKEGKQEERIEEYTEKVSKLIK